MLLSIIPCTTEVLNTDLMSVIRHSALEERDIFTDDNYFLITMQFFSYKQFHDSKTYLAFSISFLLLTFNHSLTNFICFSFLNDSSPTKINCGTDKIKPAMTRLHHLCSALFSTCLFRFQLCVYTGISKMEINIWLTLNHCNNKCY